MNELAIPTLLLVDDDRAWRERLGRALEARGFQVTLAESYDDALAKLSEPPEYAVLDLRMPGRSGLELLVHLKALDPATVVLVLTGYGSIPTAVEAIKLGASGYLTKPADADEVTRALLQPGPHGAPPSPAHTPSLARAEWEYIQRVLADSQHNLSEAARRLGLHRRSLQRKLRKYPPPR